jgi:hypothetical protein
MIKLQGVKRNVMTKAFAYFKSITPIDTGNARRKTRLDSRFRIIANYAYAFVLDKGRHMASRGMRGSKQAPKGMSNPTIKKFGQWVKNFIRGV